MKVCVCVCVCVCDEASMSLVFAVTQTCFAHCLLFSSSMVLLDVVSFLAICLFIMNNIIVFLNTFFWLLKISETITQTQKSN